MTAQKMLKRVKIGFNLQRQLKAESVSEYRFKIKQLIFSLIDCEKSEEITMRDLLQTIVINQAKTDNAIFFKDWFPKYQKEKISSG
ncbi:hypothetical protein EAC88_22260, partial [Salmonella enterica]|nr:hypothetical protein [Salmonella enterica]EDO4567845.1 hypothetical protein [Salmonella enterica subsp. enterica serovar Braenderup]